MNSFVAIDFETANPKRVSACSLGLVRVDGGEIADRRSYLIKPVGEYAPLNVRIHGIRPEMTADAPTFDCIYKEIRPYFEEYPVISYSSFDRSVFEALRDYYSLPLVRDVTFVDVYSFARTAIQGLPNYKLPTVSYHLHLPEFDHHDAAADALQCAEVFLRLEEMSHNAYDPFFIAHDEGWEKPFARFVQNVLSDGVVDEREAYELQRFLGAVSDEGKVFRDVANLVDDVLEDGVVTKVESDVLCALLRYVLVEMGEADDMLCPRDLPGDMRGGPSVKPDIPDLTVPGSFVPRMKDIPSNYKERWDYLSLHPFETLASSHVVITEDGVRISRQQAERLVNALGATLKQSVTRDTDFCVVLGMSPERCMTGKVKKARCLQGQGSPIRILSEDDFISLVQTSIEEGCEYGV